MLCECGHDEDNHVIGHYAVNFRPCFECKCLQFQEKISLEQAISNMEEYLDSGAYIPQKGDVEKSFRIVLNAAKGLNSL